MRKLKFIYQIITRGWCDSDTWNLDDTIKDFVLPRLERFKELNNGHPHDITQEQWNQELDKMIYAFKRHGINNDDPKIQEGFESFGKYLTHLWW